MFLLHLPLMNRDIHVVIVDVEYVIYEGGQDAESHSRKSRRDIEHNHKSDWRMSEFPPRKDQQKQPLDSDYPRGSPPLTFSDASIGCILRGIRFRLSFGHESLVHSFPCPSGHNHGRNRHNSYSQHDFIACCHRLSLQTDEATDISVGHAPRGARVDDSFESLRSGCVCSWQGDADTEYRGINVWAKFVRLDSVIDLHCTRTEIASHSVGVLRIRGSVSPAASLKSDTSLYVFATAMMCISSSESATHESNGADRNNSSRILFFRDMRSLITSDC